MNADDARNTEKEHVGVGAVNADDARNTEKEHEEAHPLDEVEKLLNPKKTVSVFLRVAFIIGIIPVITVSYFLTRRVIRDSEKLIDATPPPKPLTPQEQAAVAAQNAELARQQAIELERKLHAMRCDIDVYDTELSGLNAILQAHQNAADSKWIARTKDKEEEVSLRKAIQQKTEERGQLVREYNAIAPIGSHVK